MDNLRIKGDQNLELLSEITKLKETEKDLHTHIMKI